MVTLQDLKDYLNIDYDNDDSKLDRKLKSAIRIVERYTNHSLRNRVDKIVSNGLPIQYFFSPIERITGAKEVCYNDVSATIYSKSGDTIEIILGVSDEPNLDEAVLRIASSLYENIEISEITLPLDVQLLINQFRRDDFLN